MDEVLKAREAAAFLKISERTLWSQCWPRGEIPVVRIGRSVRFSKAALLDYIAQQSAAK